ncbi:histone-lysine N-methyltransferase SETD7 isoform X2 [Eurytemora carolleeae]|uniref:histone-lysine N-methyltransferase SETD7 isoform X2 n=1 Tax=Eurytemora carolleeae TaxID=1294199 RepID=UPI000C7631FD|nr:histone-lysine N-methyltransferase SETD7 isoform X2 [Eurytemora carolleeae]|eukprot:XP_023322361.1 histone-lysine N-methyltransferase SETD7-like isoform X2 [Eurytemora affinis]
MNKSAYLGESSIQMLHTWIRDICDPDFICKTILDQIILDQLVKEGMEIDTTGIPWMNQLEDIRKNYEKKDGFVRSEHEDGSIFDACFKDKKPHGVIRKMNGLGDLEFYGCIAYGKLLGVCWKSVPGGGFMISSNVVFSGPGTIYLYPDCRLGFSGTFKDCLLVSGLLIEVTGFESDERLQEYKMDISSSELFSSFPLLAEPYESIFVEVGESRIPGAGQGLFAKVDIAFGTVIGFYNGHKVAAEHDFDTTSPYRISLDKDIDLDIPEHLTNLDRYQATLGHKVCHSFDPNSNTDLFLHPRFGLIRCIVTIKNIEAGSEVTINYSYDMTTAPDWYRIAWAKHQKNVRGLPDWRMAMLKSGINIFEK